MASRLFLASANLGQSMELRIRRNANSLRVDEINTPNLFRVSGASIWALKSVSYIWSHEAATFFLGVHPAYLHSKYVIAKSWRTFAEIIEQSAPELAKLFKLKLII